MADVACVCDDSGQNLGIPSCTQSFKTTKKVFFVSIFDSEGNRNSIKDSDFVGGVLPDSFFADKISETDKSKRFYPSPSVFKDVEPGRTDTTTKEYADGTIDRLSAGVKTFSFKLPKQQGALAASFLSFGCGTYGVYEIDTTKSLRGEMSADGTEMYPEQIESGSIDSFLVDEIEGSDPSMVSLTFQLSTIVTEGNLEIIGAAQMATDLLKVNGLIDATLISLAAPAPSATTFSITMGVSNYGNAFSTIPIQGQTTPAKWLVVDSGASVITPSGIVESVNGQYDFTIPSTPAETLSITYVSTLAVTTVQGFESNITTIVTP